MQRDLPLVLRLAILWLLFATWASATGWMLSLLKALHGPGYAISAVPLVLSSVLLWRFTGKRIRRPLIDSPRLRIKWRRPGFLVWLILSTLALLGGLIHPPSNYDALTYRLPRLYYWLQEHHWFWIDDPNFRMNIAGTAIEWMSAPLLLLTGGDRFLFLLNFLPYLAIPSLIFLAASGLGLRPRTARWWMWILPACYGCLLQAASIGNDLTGTVLFLASLAFAFEAKNGRPFLCLAFSALAAALMTGIKVTMLPLGLPIAVVWIACGIQTLGPKRLSTLCVAISPLAAICSFLPIALLCWQFTGHWTGNPGNVHRIAPESPISGLVGNGVDLTKGWLAPPVMPAASQVDNSISAYLDHTRWYPWLQERYHNYRITLGPELPSEEGAGAGIGLTAVLCIWAFHRRNRRLSRERLGGVFAFAILASALAFLAMAGGASAPRLMLPWTPGILLTVLWFKSPIRCTPPAWLASLPGILILPALVLNPNRPLIPGSRLASLPVIPSSLSQRMESVYSTYSIRNKIAAPLANQIPDRAVVGFAGGRDHSPAALFQPLHRLIIQPANQSTLPELDWIIGTEGGIRERLQTEVCELTRLGFRIKAQQQITSKVQQGPEQWFLLERIPDFSPNSSSSLDQ